MNPGPGKNLLYPGNTLEYGYGEGNPMNGLLLFTISFSSSPCLYSSSSSSSSSDSSSFSYELASFSFFPAFSFAVATAASYLTGFSGG
jgi:hypothetical protein